MGCGGSKPEEAVTEAAQIALTLPESLPDAAGATAVVTAGAAERAASGTSAAKAPPPVMMPNPMAELQLKMKARGAQSDEGAIVSSGGAVKAASLAQSGGPDALLSRARGAKGRRPPSVVGKKGGHDAG